MESCEICGFEWDAVRASDLCARVAAGVQRLIDLMGTGHPTLPQRPADGVWSAVEYAAHVRDVLLNLRDRIVLGSVEDNPVPKPMYGTWRMERMGAVETPAQLVAELAVARDLFNRVVAALTADELSRPIFYPYPRPETRTVLWVAAQALHEVEHHAADAAASAAAASA